MNCKSFQKLSEVEREQYVAELLHVVQTHDDAFKIGKALIRGGKDDGLFEGVKIGRDVYQENDLLTTTG